MNAFIIAQAAHIEPVTRAPWPCGRLSVELALHACVLPAFICDRCADRRMNRKCGLIVCLEVAVLRDLLFTGVLSISFYGLIPLGLRKVILHFFFF